jgi:hypothetical protein
LRRIRNESAQPGAHSTTPLSRPFCSSRVLRSAWLTCNVRNHQLVRHHLHELVIGLQTRAEVIAWLLAHESGHPAEIARATGYFRGSIQSVLNELATSGHVYAVRTGREKNFGLRLDDWRFLLTWPEAKSFPRWLPWPEIMALFQRINYLLENPKMLTTSAAAQAIEFERVLAPAAQVLTPAGLWPAPPSGLTGEVSLQANIDRVLKLLAQFQND